MRKHPGPCGWKDLHRYCGQRAEDPELNGVKSALSLFAHPKLLGGTPQCRKSVPLDSPGLRIELV